MKTQLPTFKVGDRVIVTFAQSVHMIDTVVDHVTEKVGDIVTKSGHRFTAKGVGFSPWKGAEIHARTPDMVKRFERAWLLARFERAFHGHLGTVGFTRNASDDRLKALIAITQASEEQLAAMLAAYVAAGGEP